MKGRICVILKYRILGNNQWVSNIRGRLKKKEAIVTIG